MIALAELLVSLLETVPQDGGGLDDGVRIEIDEVELTLPIEVRFAARGGIEASAPRGRYATGFDLPHHVLSLAVTPRGAG